MRGLLLSQILLRSIRTQTFSNKVEQARRHDVHPNADGISVVTEIRPVDNEMQNTKGFFSQLCAWLSAHLFSKFQLAYSHTR
jgi:hypothetical protein